MKSWGKSHGTADEGEFTLSISCISHAARQPAPLPTFSLSASPLKLLPLLAAILHIADIVYLWSQRRHVASPVCSQDATTRQKNIPPLPQNPEAIEIMSLQRAGDGTLHLCETLYHEWGWDLSLRRGSSFI